MSYKSVLQEYTRVSHKGFRKDCVLQECPTKVSATRVSKIVWVFVFEYVFAFGFVGSILFPYDCHLLAPGHQWHQRRWHEDAEDQVHS